MYFNLAPKPLTYPEVLTISSRGSATEAIPEIFGVYRKVPFQLENKKPIWKLDDSEHYFYYNGSHWIVTEPSKYSVAQESQSPYVKELLKKLSSYITVKAKQTHLIP